MIFLKDFLEKNIFEKNLQTTKMHAKLPSMQQVKRINSLRNRLFLVIRLEKSFLRTLRMSNSLSEEKHKDFLK